MRYVRTKLGTNWRQSSRARETLWRIVRTALFFLPKGNPDYDDRLHLVREWLVEFDDEGSPIREVGLDAQGAPVIRGPDGRNIGFWLDTHMKLTDFEGEHIDQEQFNTRWNEFRGFIA
jgi:hypothetical protein